MLDAWQKHEGFSISQLISTPNIRSVGMRTGLHAIPLIAFDFDGSTSVDLACQIGMAPWNYKTWHIHRTTDPWRLKVIGTLTPEQLLYLTAADGDIEFQGKIPTAPAPDGGKGEALEVFFSGLRQVVILGDHPTSGGQYFWPEGLGPEDLAPLPDAWLAFALKVADRSRNRIKGASKRRGGINRSGTTRLDPCPICGRHSGQGGSSLWCDETTEGLIFCMPGSTFNAEQRHGQLTIGKSVVNTARGQYALVQRAEVQEGTVLVFKPHQAKGGVSNV